jgi:hypothetical protein
MVMAGTFHCSYTAAHRAQRAIRAVFEIVLKMTRAGIVVIEAGFALEMCDRAGAMECVGGPLSYCKLMSQNLFDVF